jgi:hypothetical protein
MISSLEDIGFKAGNPRGPGERILKRYMAPNRELFRQMQWVMRNEAH